MQQSLAASVEPSIEQLISDVEREGTSGLAANQLFRALYDELHRLAERQLRRGGGELTLGATTLLHEAYLHISQRDGARFPDRARFMGYAARAMRHVVIDCARRSQAQKRGGGVFEVTLDDAIAPNAGDRAPELERLSVALDDLAKLDPMMAQLVDLHFFCGYTFGEIATMRGVSERTVHRDWRKARLLLHRDLTSDAP